MLACNSCHRYVRTDEDVCPFCGTAVCVAIAPTRLSVMALAMGLTVLGCTDDGEDKDDMKNTTTSNGSETGDLTGGTTGDGDGDPGDGDGDATTGVPDTSSSDYGAPPPPYDAECWF